MSRVVPIISALPSLTALATTLKRYAAELPADELPALVGAMEEAKALAWSRLVRPEPRQPGADASSLLGAKAMADRLGVDASWVRDRARRGLIPCIRAGRYRRFDPAAVIWALQEQKVA
jgi:hypothetical protein